MVERDQAAEHLPSFQELRDQLADASRQASECHATALRELVEAAEVAIGLAERTAEKLRKREGLIDSSATGLALWDLEGRIEYVNAAFSAMWGYVDPEDVVGESIVDLLGADPKSQTIPSAIDQLGGWIGKLELIGKDGSPFTCMLSVFVVRDPRGQPAAVAGSFVEMTYRERLNEMLFRQEDWLRALHAVNNGMLGDAELAELGENALEDLQALLPCTGSSVTTFHLSDGTAELLARAPGDPPLSGDGHRASLVGFERTLERLREGQVCSFEDGDSPPLPAAVLGLEVKTGPSLWVVAPLMARGQLLGSLNVKLDREVRLTNLHESILGQFSSSLAVAVLLRSLQDTVAYD